jgi:hypothetical protein
MLDVTEGGPGGASERRVGVKMGTKEGFEYFKFRSQLAMDVLDRLAKITQYNYIVLSSGLAVGSLASAATEGKHLVFSTIVCIFIATVSVLSGILSYLYYNWAAFLLERSYIAERGWLRNTDGAQFVDEKLRKEKSRYFARANEIDWSLSGLRDLFLNVYFQINAAPAIFAVFILVVLGRVYRITPG